MFITTILMGIHYFTNARVNDTLIQYYISTLIYILVLFYFQRIVSHYIEADLLKKHAYCDALTDIGNRRSIDKWFEMEFKRCHNSNNIFSVIYFDINHFKKINDEYGHDIGDYVLKEFVSLVKKYIQPNDFFGRWGGEEFIIILKNKTLLEAAEIAEYLRNIIENHPFRYVHRITSSFGVASFQSNDMPKTIIKRADQALYMAKKTGRNKVQAL